MRVGTIVNETPLQLKSYTDPHSFIVGDFNISFSPMDRSCRQKLNREQLELANIKQPNGPNSYYNTLHPNTKEYIHASQQLMEISPK